MYKPATSSSSVHSTYGPSIYPRIGQSGHSVNPTTGRVSSFHHTSPSSSSSPGLGIKVAIKPEYRITPSPQLSPQIGDIALSTFQVDFELERKILAEAKKENQNWSRLGLENLPSKTAELTSSLVREFVNRYNLLRDMGFSSKNVAEALVMFDNDTDKALAHFLNSSAC